MGTCIIGDGPQGCRLFAWSYEVHHADQTGHRPEDNIDGTAETMDADRADLHAGNGQKDAQSIYGSSRRVCSERADDGTAEGNMHDHLPGAETERIGTVQDHET